MTNSVLQDPYLRALYETAFKSITDNLPKEVNTLVEIGAGDGISNQFLPKAFLTDIAFHKNLNAICNAHELPFKSASVDALALKDSLHHLPSVELFLNEAHRVLRIGGRVVVFDPYWGLLAKFVYRCLHFKEIFTPFLGILRQIHHGIQIKRCRTCSFVETGLNSSNYSLSLIFVNTRCL